MDDRPPNFPPTYDEATKPGTTFTAPPVGSVSAAQAAPPLQPMGQQPPIILQQPPQAQAVYIQPNGATVYMTQPQVVMVHPLKMAPCFDPYTETCPYCRVSVVTRRRFAPGGMTCIFLILGIIFLPFLCFMFCNSFKDAHHYCPRCSRLIAIRKR